MHGGSISAAVDGWRAQRKKLATVRKPAWDRMLTKFIIDAEEARWLLEHPVPEDVVYHEAWSEERERRTIKKPYIDRCIALITKCGTKISDEEMLILYEAFPFPEVFEKGVQQRKIRPELLIKYGLHNKFRQEGLDTLMSHLQKLPLAEQIPFLGSNRDVATAKLVTKHFQGNKHDFHFMFLENLPQYASVNCEAELTRHGLSFKNFGVRNNELGRLLPLLKGEKSALVLSLLKLSKKHSKLARQAIEAVGAKQEELEEASCGY